MTGGIFLSDIIVGKLDTQVAPQPIEILQRSGYLFVFGQNLEHILVLMLRSKGAQEDNIELVTIFHINRDRILPQIIQLFLDLVALELACWKLKLA